MWLSGFLAEKGGVVLFWSFDMDVSRTAAAAAATAAVFFGRGRGVVVFSFGHCGSG